MLIDPPGFLSSEPEKISATFSRCCPCRTHACVIDGDTFKRAQRKVRIIGIEPVSHRWVLRDELEAAGEFNMLAPGESRSYALSFAFR